MRGSQDISGRRFREVGKLYQDQLYGTKVLSQLAVAVIDSPEFQRLDGLRQLGFAYIAYRPAKHTRFDHSVGTYFACRTIMRRIAQNHERLGLEHPGTLIDDCFRFFPPNAKVGPMYMSAQSKWRGLTEVISIAALLHDLGHVPFGHTLEDEFSGIYDRHDSLGGSRLYSMLFNSSSALRSVFADGSGCPQWLPELSNTELIRLIYVILNWKEKIQPVRTFAQLLEDAMAESFRRRERAQSEYANALEEPADESSRSRTEQVLGHAIDGVKRVQDLKDWYADLQGREIFRPFMSDIVGNTICADLLDYLPRDRMNLGMEGRLHTRLQRYFTIRKGTLYANEGHRMSIMVTRKGHGGQRPDVATAVLDIMRERYEMAERVYYHHKKAAASTMLAKLAEIAVKLNRGPRDDNEIYPAPWGDGDLTGSRPPHMIHLSDFDLIRYLGEGVDVGAENAELARLQRSLYVGLRYSRRKMYRTLLVIDCDLVQKSPYSLDYLVSQWRGDSNERQALESELASLAGVPSGEVLLYCPDADMQSKEVDARLEIREDRVLPLRLQTEFVYKGDVRVLEQYYKQLWRAYIFVSPNVFESDEKCRTIVREFCTKYGIPVEEGDSKSRKLKFDGSVEDDLMDASEGNSEAAELEDRAFSVVETYVNDLPLTGVPGTLGIRLLHLAWNDTTFCNQLRENGRGQSQRRLQQLLGISVVDALLEKSPDIKELKAYRDRLSKGKVTPPRTSPTRAGDGNRSLPLHSYEEYVALVSETALGSTNSITAHVQEKGT